MKKIFKTLSALFMIALIGISCQKETIKDGDVNTIQFAQKDLITFDVQKDLILNMQTSSEQTTKSQMDQPGANDWQYVVYIKNVSKQWELLTENYYPIGSAQRARHKNPGNWTPNCATGCQSLIDIPLNRDLLFVINKYEGGKLKYTGSKIQKFTASGQSVNIDVWDQISKLTVSTDSLKLQGLKFIIKISYKAVEHTFDYLNLDQIYKDVVPNQRYTFTPSPTNQGITPVNITETTPTSVIHNMISVYGADFTVKYKVWDTTKGETEPQGGQDEGYKTLSIPEGSWIKPSYHYKVSFNTTKRNDNTTGNLCAVVKEVETITIRPSLD